MKKSLVLVLTIATFVLVACGGKKDERTLNTFADKYIEQGIEVDLERKPVFQLIGAQDGVIFYTDNNKVAIYQYADEKALKKAQEDYSSLVQDAPTNGRFMLESKNEKAIEIFNSVE